MTLTGVVNDRYEIEREIGRGGMATVYLASDLRHGNKVALKVLSPDLASMVSGERFNREIRITAGLQHPHILPVFDSGQIDGLPYYVMPFVDGPTVEQRIRNEGPLPIAEALEIAAEVADALAHAHSRGIVHRDIKPSNILLAHGHAVVADFGIARAVEPVTAGHDLTKTGIAVGTAAYMSPEQSAGEDVDGRADVYSLGCVLYEMLAGKPPFSATSPRALMAKHWMNEVPSLSALRKSVRRSIEAMVLKAMAKRADQRYMSASAFEDAIQQVSTEEKLVAAGFTPSEDQPTFAPGETVTESNPSLFVVTATSPASVHALPAPRSTESHSPAGELSGTSGRRASSWTRRIAAGVLLIAAAGAGTWKLTRPAEVPLDPRRIMVYPLLVPTDFTGSRNIGEDIGTMIGTALDGAGQLRWIDGWPLLTPAVRQDIRNLTALDARALAKSRRAAWYVTGRIVVQGDSSEVFLELNDVEGDSTVARGKAIGSTTDAWRTGLHAVNALLPVLIPGSARDVDILAEWNDRDPAAVASFLLAEGAFRRANIGEALEHYRAALRADSTFGLAALRGAQAASWRHRSDEASTFVQIALRQDLPPRYAHFTRGYGAYLEGAADSAAAELRRVVALDPEMSVAWVQLGEVYTHLLPFAANQDSLARVAFEEAHRLDPHAKQVLYHLLELRLRAGEIKESETMLREFLAGGPDSLLATQVSLMYECLTRGPARTEWAAAARAEPLAALSAANALKGGGAHLECARAGYAALVESDTSEAGSGRRWVALQGLASTLLAQRRAAEATAVIDRSIATGKGGGSFYLMASLVHPDLAASALKVAAEDAEKFGANYVNCPFPVRLWQLGLWETFKGRVEIGEAVARELDRRARQSKSPVEDRLGRSAKAFALLARGDTARASEMLRVLVAEPMNNTDLAWDVAAPRGIERLTLARLMIAAGDYRSGIQIANVFDSAWPSIFLLYLPASLEARAEAAAGAMDNRMAERFRERLAAIRGGRVVAGK